MTTQPTDAETIANLRQQIADLQRTVTDTANKAAGWKARALELEEQLIEACARIAAPPDGAP